MFQNAFYIKMLIFLINYGIIQLKKSTDINYFLSNYKIFVDFIVKLCYNIHKETKIEIAENFKQQITNYIFRRII